MRFRYDGPPTLHHALGLLEPGEHEHPDGALVAGLAAAGLVALVHVAEGVGVQTSAPAARPEAPPPPAEQDGEQEAGPAGEVEVGRKGRKRSSA